MWDELQTFEQGALDHAYLYLGCHPLSCGYVYRLWAPNAKSVHVIGSWNDWSQYGQSMSILPGGIWELECPQAQAGDLYQYRILGADGRIRCKADPYGQAAGPAPGTASLICDDFEFAWSDTDWMQARRDPLNRPINIYEVHAGSWMRTPEGQCLTYEALADTLISYVQKMHYTHLEFMPLGEHPYFPSWGYEITGFYAPTARYGSGEGLKHLIDKAHNAGIGVILDWVGAHFPKDEAGLACFDGTFLYEAADSRFREHPEWNTLAFDYEKPQVRSFLLSNAMYWLREYHFDGLRVDAVSSMIYLDPNNQQWLGPESANLNHSAISFLQTLNRSSFAWRQDVLMIAEESTTFPSVTKPDYDGGLGFNYKWNLGWMHDILAYFSAPPEMRSRKHDLLTFSMTYAFSENFVLPLSHDEVVYGKHSLLERMPGTPARQFANLRLLYACMMAHSGKKLLFMGGEIGQFREWNHDGQLDWLLLEQKQHEMLQRFTADLNRLYQTRPALWQMDCGWEGFHWLIPDDSDRCVIALERICQTDRLFFACNFSPFTYSDYSIGVPAAGQYRIVLNTDAPCYGGTGFDIQLSHSEAVPAHGYEQRIRLNLPPLSGIYFEYFREE